MDPTEGDSMSDGAHLGVTAGRALNTILGGAEEPTADEQQEPAALERYIRSTPLPDGDEIEGEDEEAYSRAAASLAHAYLVLLGEDPTLLDAVTVWSPENTDLEELHGIEREPGDALWDAFKARWPEGNERLGGLTGFQVGWAYNAVRAIKGQPPAPNPALMEIPVAE